MCKKLLSLFKKILRKIKVFFLGTIDTKAKWKKTNRYICITKKEVKLLNKK